MIVNRERKFSGEILLYLAIAGPGVITALAGNGASGITTCSVAGARFGLSLTWVLVVSTFALIIFQEMSARMGAVTGKGLAALIRERFGLRAAFFAMIVLLVANISNTISEFAGIAASLDIFGVGIWKYLAVPAITILIWEIVTRGSFRWVEKFFMALCLIQLCYIVSGFLSRPDWGRVAISLVKPEFKVDSSFVYTAIAIVGTTVAPWMQFFVQGNVVDKGTGIGDYKYQKVDVISGIISANLISLFIIICCAFTIFPRSITTAEQAARALGPLAGQSASVLFALGLFGASMLSASVIPISTSYAVCEALGWESGIGKKYSEAPIFFGIFAFSLVTSTLVVLIPGISLVRVQLLAQELNGILLPIILVYMLSIVNDRRIMGEHVNGNCINIVAWAMAFGIIILSFTLFFVGLKGS